MTIDVGSGRDAQNAPEAMTPGGTGESARPRAGSRQRRAVTLGIELDAVAHFLRSRRFREQVIVGGIVLLALRRMARENRARAFARMAAWDKRRNLRYQRTAKTRPA
ncbi:MAG: hypothetical protein ACM3ML_29770 [Micromonosporaceae bacterium]